MKVKFFCPIWGLKDMPLERALEKIKSDGYDGAEIGLNPDIQDLEKVKSLFTEYDLELLAQHPFSKGSTFNELLADYTSKLERILNTNPVKVNCHTGKDYFTFDENSSFIQAADMLAQSYNIELSHEIHRGKFSFCTALIGQYLEAFPNIKLTADFSHWCVVSESLLEDQEEIIDRVVPHCTHIHARVGYAQGPQVSHPGAPEHAEALEKHLKWWKKILQHHQRTHQEVITINCEFGPLPYMPTLPFTNVPIASQYEVNLFMKNYLMQNLKTEITTKKETP